MSSQTIRVLVPPTVVPGRGAAWAAAIALWLARGFAAPSARRAHPSVRAVA